MISWNQIGDWNPQLIREVRGRLRSSGLWLTLGGAILAQVLLMVVFYSLVPQKTWVDPVSRYCTGYMTYEGSHEFVCELNAAGDLILNMQVWWQDLFRLLTWAVPLIWLTGSVYILIGDLVKERQQGTLNFVQLSPRSALSICVGKLLGVPILLHLLAGSFLPLHLLAAAWGQIDGSHLVWFYGGLLGVWGMLSAGAMLFALLGGSQPWLGTVAALLGIHPALWLIAFGLWRDEWKQWGWAVDRSAELVQFNWFGLPIGSTVWMAGLFVMISCGVALAWIGWTMIRRFEWGERTLLSKRSSYLLTLCLNLFGVGFVWSTLSPQGWIPSHLPPQDQVVVFSGVQIPFGLALILSLLPRRQAILDWIYYRRDRASSQPMTLIRDLIWGENSPPILALGINLGIMLLIWLPLVMMEPLHLALKGEVSLGIMAIVPLWGIYGVSAQLLGLMRGGRPWWPGAGIVGLLCVPFLVGALWHEALGGSTGIWVFFVYGAGSVHVDHFPLPGTLIGMSLPWLVLGILIGVLVSRIRSLGRSEAQQIWAAGATPQRGALATPPAHQYPR